MGEFSLPIKVYIEDTDAGGIVYHANYLKFMERSRTEYLATFGFDKPATLDDGLLLVVHSMNIEFRSAARLGDMLQATTEVLSAKRSYVIFEQQVRHNQQLLCRAEVKIACVHAESMKPTAMPEVMQKSLKSAQN
ncbi:tol-pal system-associated acyl-CoA thioesterase [Aurantivibrio plasticivorans]